MVNNAKIYLLLALCLSCKSPLLHLSFSCRMKGAIWRSHIGRRNSDLIEYAILMTERKWNDLTVWFLFVFVFYRHTATYGISWVSGRIRIVAMTYFTKTAASATYTAHYGNTGCLTHWAMPEIELSYSQRQVGSLAR